MLRVLRIENIAVAKEVELELESGFSVLTGETGAGKSILLDGLSLALGGRISRDMIRPGESTARVTAIFSDVSHISRELEDLGIETDSEGEIEITRTFTEDGKTSSKVNRRSVSVSVLRELSELLININSQGDSHISGEKGASRQLLDSYSDLDGLLSEYSSLYHSYRKACSDLDEIKKSLRDKEMMIDILRYQLKEIDSAKLSDVDEEEKLEKMRLRLKDVEKIAKYSGLIVRALSQNEKGATASYMLERAQTALEQLSGIMENADEYAQKLEAMRYELIDIAERAADLVGEDLSNPEQKLDRIETRLAQISKLEKKYGINISEILRFREDAADKLKKLENGEDAVHDAENDVSEAYEKAVAVAGKISECRRENAKKLSASVSDSLKYLDMPKALFDIRVTPKYEDNGRKELDSGGYDDVTFMFTANSGYEMKELSRVASGGELSRTVLALKCALSDKNGVDTVVFDEIDTGVSGATSEKIGLLLRKLSKTTQVICVTHSPQVASLCDAHYLIKKTEIDKKAQSSVHRLEFDERVAEIARIIGGVEVTEKQINAAREMIEKTKNI